MAIIRLLDSFTGPGSTVSDATPINVGIEFAVSAACQITAVWWWQAAGGTVSTATRTAGVYPASGTATLLGSGTAAPTGSGWQRVPLSAPVDLAVGSYRAVILMPAGQYSASSNWWLSGAGQPGSDGLVNGILSAPNSTTVVGAGGQQSFTESASLSRTEQAFGQSSYWIDVEIDTGSEPVPLDTPVVTVTTEVDPSTPGGTDGSITVTWPAVPNADHYEAGIADGHGQTSGFTVTSTSAVSPYTFTGLDAGDYTVAIRAMPAG